MRICLHIHYIMHYTYNVYEQDPSTIVCFSVCLSHIPTITFYTLGTDIETRLYETVAFHEKRFLLEQHCSITLHTYRNSARQPDKFDFFRKMTFFYERSYMYFRRSWLDKLFRENIDLALFRIKSLIDGKRTVFKSAVVET